MTSGATLGGGGDWANRTAITGNTVTIEADGTLSPGNSPGIMEFDTLNLETGSITVMEIWGTDVAGIDYDQIVINDTINFSEDWILQLDFKRIAAGDYELNLFNWGSATGTEKAPVIEYLNGSSSDGIFVWDSNTGNGVLQFTYAIPEPSSLLLLILAGMALMRRRRR